MRVATDLIHRQKLICDLISKAHDALGKGKDQEALHTLTLLNKELKPEILPLYDPKMLEIPTSFFGRVFYIIKWWKVLWEDLTCQLRTSNNRLEKL